MTTNHKQNNLNYLVTQTSRDTYNEFLFERDTNLCQLVQSVGLKTTCELTGWSKPTVIAALKKISPELLKRSSFAKGILETK